MQQSGLPMFFQSDPNTISEQIVWLVKNSKLNFQLQETPYSLTIEIKKRFLNKWSEGKAQEPTSVENPQLNEQISFLKNKNEALEHKLNEALDKLNKATLLIEENTNNAAEKVHVKLEAFQVDQEVMMSELANFRDVAEEPVRRKRRKKKIENVSVSSSDMENLADEYYLHEPIIPCSNKFQGLENFSDNESREIKYDTGTDNPESKCPNSFTSQVNIQSTDSDQEEPSFTPPGTPPKMKLKNVVEVKNTVVKSIDTNNNDNIEENRTAADTLLQELIAKNLKRLKQNQIAS